MRETSTVPTRTWENLAPERRERIVRAAMTEFGRHGYSGGSLNVIAREAGVAKGSLFQYFADKFDLFAYVAEQTAFRVRDHMAPWLVGPDPQRPFFEFMCDALDAWVRYFAEHPLERRVTVATNLEVDSTVRAAVRAPINKIYVDGLRPILERAREHGDLYPDADIEALLAMLLVLLPHLAMAPFEPGMDPLLGMYGKSPGRLRAPVRRLLVATIGEFGPVPGEAVTHRRVRR
jgi:AcrR family transcriptional regulator